MIKVGPREKTGSKEYETRMEKNIVITTITMPNKENAKK
jgi:hypothetical protein